MSAMSDRFRFPFPPPSLGDELLARASLAKIWFHRPMDEERAGQPAQCEFEIQGSLPSSLDQAAIVRRIAEHFCAPREEDPQPAG